MELLFDYGDNNGNEEIKALIGHVDKDISFNKLKPDLTTATLDLIKIIGQPVYDDVLTKYKEGAESAGDLIYYTRQPIALDGYRHSAKASDVAHTNNGRKIRVDEHNKVPFEWLLDRDDEIFERKYYKAVDILIDYLDANSTVWKASNAFKDSQKLYVRKTSDFDEFFQINSRLLLLKLQPGLRQCERKKIIPLIGMERDLVIKTKLQNDGELTTEEKDLVSLIKEACVFYSLAWGMKTLRVTLFPDGILQKYTSERMSTRTTKVSEKMETELVAQELEKRAQELFIDIQNKMTVINPTPPSVDVLDKITFPHFKFDDNDSFASI